jgi:NADH-quinone oxidoreductase subunit B
MQHRMAPVLKRVDDQMGEPPWVVACGACAASDRFACRDATMQGSDRGIPVDVSMAGCPPRPKPVLEGLRRLQHKVDTAERLDRRAPLRVDQGRQSLSRPCAWPPPTSGGDMMARLV